SRNKNAKRHQYEQQRGEQRDKSRSVAVCAPHVESIMQRVSCPSHLPGAKIILAALLVKISENQKEQQSNKARDDNRADSDTIHDRQTTPVALNVFTPRMAKQQF